MQHARRHNPYPWTWEIPAGVCMAVGLVLALGVQAARAGANLLAGAGWTWPVDQARFWASLPAVVGGDADAGLAQPAPASVAGAELVWTCLALTELACLVGVGWALKECVQRWGPGRLRGMATRTEAEQVLGLTRLRKVRAVVRPDLYARHSPTPAGGDRVAHRGAGGREHA